MNYRESVLDLVGHTPLVMADLLRMPQSVQRVMVRHTRRTADGMADFVRRSPDAGEIELDDLDDLKMYCYTVAGIVGEMLTDLFLLELPALSDHAPDLRRRGVVTTSQSSANSTVRSSFR